MRMYLLVCCLLLGHTLSAENNYMNYKQVDNMSVFVRKLKELLGSGTFNGKTVCIVSSHRCFIVCVCIITYVHACTCV